MENSPSPNIFNRGYRPSVQILFFTALSLALLFADARYRYLDSVRYLLSVLVHPVQQLVTAPSRWWYAAEPAWQTHEQLVRDNAALRQQHEQDRVQLQQWQTVLAENQQLRRLAALPPHPQYRAQTAEILYVERELFKRKVFVNKGAQAHVQAGQVVIDDLGIVGQVTRVYPLLSEITLITDKAQAVPVEVQRNQLRTVAFGAGDMSHLAVRYLPVSADIQAGDLLVTSGIDGTYPTGFPVAKVSKVEKDAAYPFARIECEPVARIEQHHHLLILAATSDMPLPERPPSLPDNELGKPAKKKRGGQP